MDETIDTKDEGVTDVEDLSGVPEPIIIPPKEEEEKRKEKLNDEDFKVILDDVGQKDFVQEDVSYIFDNSSGVIVNNKGIVIQDRVITDSPEWRSYYSDGIKGLDRASMPLDYTRHDHGINAQFGRKRGKRPKGISSRILNKQLRRGLVQSKADKRLVMAHSEAHYAIRHFEQLNKTAEKIIFQIIKDYFYKKKKEGQIVQPKEAKILVAAAVMIAVELINLPIPKNEILEYFRTRLGYRPEVSKNLEHEIWVMMKKISDYGIKRNIMKVLSEDYNRRNSISRRSRQFERVKTFVRYIVSELILREKYPGMTQHVASQTIKLLDAILNGPETRYMKALPGKKPEAIAAAGVYLTARLLNFEVSQKEVAEIVAIKESNVRKAFRFLIENLTILVLL